MSARHTPGPWFLHAFDDGSMAIQPAVGFMIMPLKPRAGFKCDIPNFKLAAAAPDLLDALEKVVHCSRYLPSQGDEMLYALEHLREIARAAIAKAQGGAL